MGKNNIQVFDTPSDLSFAAYTFIVDLANKTVKNNGKFVIALSGGHTPEHLYTLLSMHPFKDDMPWNETFIFWGDERCVPFSDKDNNAHMTMSLLLEKVAIPPLNINRIPVDLSPEAAAAAYEQTIKDFFGCDTPRFDLILLGLGENGHIASLFPGTDVLTERLHLVRAVYVEEQKMFRITMTLPLINLAYNILFLVEGRGKAEILKSILSGNDTFKYPALLVAPVNGSVYWFVDGNAAYLLPHIP